MVLPACPQVKRMSDSGVKEVTLLGQNVNSYADFSHVPGSRPLSDHPDPFSSYAQVDPHLENFAVLSAGYVLFHVVTTPAAVLAFHERSMGWLPR